MPQIAGIMQERLLLSEGVRVSFGRDIAIMFSLQPDMKPMTILQHTKLAQSGTFIPAPNASTADSQT